MNPTQEINRHLAALREKLGNLKPDQESALQLVELWARQHAHQIETREVYVSEIEQIAKDRHTAIKEQSDELDRVKTRLGEIEGEPKRKAERIARLKDRQAEIAAELAREEEDVTPRR